MHAIFNFLIRCIPVFCLAMLSCTHAKNAESFVKADRTEILSIQTLAINVSDCHQTQDRSSVWCKHIEQGNQSPTRELVQISSESLPNDPFVRRINLSESLARKVIVPFQSGFIAISRRPLTPEEIAIHPNSNQGLELTLLNERLEEQGRGEAYIRNSSEDLSYIAYNQTLFVEPHNGGLAVLKVELNSNGTLTVASRVRDNALINNSVYNASCHFRDDKFLFVSNYPTMVSLIAADSGTIEFQLENFSQITSDRTMLNALGQLSGCSASGNGSRGLLQSLISRENYQFLSFQLIEEPESASRYRMVVQQLPFPIRDFPIAMQGFNGQRNAEYMVETSNNNEAQPELRLTFYDNENPANAPHSRVLTEQEANLLGLTIVKIFDWPSDKSNSLIVTDRSVLRVARR